MSDSNRIAYIQQLFSRIWGGVRFKSGESDDVPFIANLGQARFAVRILSVNAPRIDDINGRLAISISELGPVSDSAQERPLLAVVSPRFGQPTVDAVEVFMERHAKNMAWALIDHKGHIHFFDPKRSKTLDEYLDLRLGRPSPKAAARTPGTSAIFTDLNAWMLKILSLANVPKEHWSGPRDKIVNPTQLAKIAGVGVQTAHVFVKALTKHGFADVGRGGVRLLRKKALLDLLLDHSRGQGLARTPVRSIFGVSIEWEELKARSPVGRYAIGGLEACDRHGLRHVTGGIPWIHIDEPINNYLDRWDLQECPYHEAQAAIVMPRHRESLFRGLVERDGLPVIDILQCAIDAITQPGRGMEQAEFIVEHLLQYDDVR